MGPVQTGPTHTCGVVMVAPTKAPPDDGRAEPDREGQRPAGGEGPSSAAVRPPEAPAAGLAALEPGPGAGRTLAAIVVVTLAHWAVLVLRLPVLQAFPGWFWHWTDTPLGALWLLPLLVALPAAALYGVLRWRGRGGLKLLVLVLVGLVLQFGLALLEGRGIDALRDRLVASGHAEFVTVAAGREDVLYVLSHYEQLVQAGELGQYAHSKPPGQLLLYMATARVARWVHPLAGPEARAEWLRTFASYLWPALSTLVLVPLSCFVRIFLDEERAILACIFYLFVPAVNLITLHTDQVFFPTMATGCLLLAALACRRASLVLGLVAGACLYLSVFCSFGLANVAPLIAATCLAVSYRPAQRRFDGRALLRAGLGLLAGVVLADLLFRFGLNYDILVRYREATAYHAAWKGWDASAVTLLYFAFLNPVEYAVWLGLPLAVLAVAHMVRSVKRVVRGDFAVSHSLSAMLLVVLVLLLLLGRTKGEVARLWLFLVPVVGVAAADEVLLRFASWRRWVIPLLVGLQGVTVYLTKVHQDFW